MIVVKISNISIGLNISLIIVLLIGMIFIFRLIIKKETDIPSIDKIIDLFKTIIITTVGAIIVNIGIDYYKERETDKSEMLIFNQYLPYITDTTGTLDKKINFCTFFKCVTPEGDLKTGWESYTKYLVTEKEKVNELNKSSTKENTNKNYESNLNPIVDELPQLESNEIQIQKILVDNNAVENTSYIIILGADNTYGSALPEQKWAIDKIDTNAKIYKKGKWFMTVIPNKNSFEEAKKISEKIKNISNRKAYVVSTKTWCNNTHFSEKEKCLICN